MQNLQTVLEQRNDSQIVSERFLRCAIGVIGIALPFVLVLGNAFIYEDSILQPSISDYYYTQMRNVLVGALCAIGVFFSAYRGFNKIDSYLGTATCIFALGVAFFPTSPVKEQLPECVELPAKFIGYFHIFFAGSLFLTLASFSLFLFTRTDPKKTPTPEKKTRNVIYYTCGTIILVAILLIAAAWAWDKYVFDIDYLHATYWLEAVAIVSFGISWLIKGEFIFADK